MMKLRQTGVAGAVVLGSLCPLALADKPATPELAAPLSVGLGVASVRADEAFAHAVLNPLAVKGGLGESLAERVYLDSVLGRSRWQSLTPRSGPQGLDHVFIKTDKTGRPVDLMVAESKFSSSLLGMTADGVQMGTRWTTRRLLALGSRYADAALAESAMVSPCPLSARHVCKVQLPDGSSGCFWRYHAKEAWKYDGTAESLAAARKQAGLYGEYLQAAGQGTISYGTRIFHIQPDGSDLFVTVRRADNLQSAVGVRTLPKTEEFVLKNAWDTKGQITAEVRDDIARTLMRKCGFAEGEARDFSNRLCRHAAAGELAEPFSMGSYLARNAALMGGAAALLDMTLQLGTTGTIHAGHTLESAGIATLGGAAALGAEQLAMRYAAARSAMSSVAPTALGRTLLRGGAAFALVDASAGYVRVALGNGTMQEANRNALMASGASLGGALTGSAALSLMAAYGTASTGTAIATLSGAAATNASLAAFGGGAVAAGGGGMALGAAALGGIVTLGAIGAGYLIYKGFELYDKTQEVDRVKQLLDYYTYDSNWQKVYYFK